MQLCGPWIKFTHALSQEIVPSGLDCSESVRSCLTVSADWQLSEVKHTHMPQNPNLIDTGHIRPEWKLNWTERNCNDLDWRSRTHCRGIRQPRCKMKRQRINSVTAVYPRNSYLGSQWDEESIPACIGWKAQKPHENGWHKSIDQIYIFMSSPSDIWWNLEFQ